MFKQCHKIAVLIIVLFSFFSMQAQEVENDDIAIDGAGHGVTEAKALISAKRDVIKKAIRVVLTSQIEIINYEKMVDKAVTRNLGAIKKYSVLSKHKNKEGVFEASIKAIVSRGSLRKNLTSLNLTIESMEKPTAMVIITENNVDIKYQASHAAEDAITDFLRNKHNFEVIDPSIASSIKESPEKMKTLSEGEKGASSIGAMYGAEIIITGYATSALNDEVSDKPGGLQFVQAEVKLEATNCTTGEKIMSGEAHETKVHISPKIAGAEAIGIACRKILKKNIPVILENWNTQIIKGVPLTVSIKQVSSIRIKNAVTRTIKGIHGVVSVSEQAWDEKNELLRITVNYKGNTNEFCETSNGYKMITGGGSLALTGQNGTQVSLILQAK